MNTKFESILHTLYVSDPTELAEIRQAIMDAFGIPPGMIGGGVREPRIPIQPLLIEHKRR